MHTITDQERDNTESESETDTETNTSEISTAESENSTNTEIEINEPKMAHMNKVEFLGLCGRTNIKIFEGDPLDTRSFTDSVKLLEEFATNYDLTKILINFILSKLNGSVREKVPDQPNTVAQITEALISKIRPESSDIIEGRLLALNTKKLDEFQEKAQKLAESLERSLILEGVQSKKAQEMTVKATVALCRKKASAPDVRAVLSATSFSTPKEVIAKMITQINVVRDERMSDFYKKNNKFSDRKPHYANKKFSGRGGHNNQNYDKNNSQNGNKQYKRQFDNGYRGRGNKQGQNNHQRGGNNNGGYNNNNSNNNGSIRTYTGQSENSETPQQFQLGANQM